MRRYAFCLLILLVLGCAHVPYTQRSQLILVSPAEEAKLGAEAYGEVLAKSRVDENGAVVGPVEEVGQRIGRAADRPDYRWQFTVIDDPKQQNAFALPRKPQTLNIAPDTQIKGAQNFNFKGLQ